VRIPFAAIRKGKLVLTEALLKRHAAGTSGQVAR
jgi:hypothetical protein